MGLLEQAGLIWRFWPGPAEAFEVDTVALIERHPFTLEQLTLDGWAEPWARADLSLAVDHALPWDVIGRVGHGPSDPDRGRPQILIQRHPHRWWDEMADLAVCHDSTPGDHAYDGVNLFGKGSGVGRC